MRSNRRCTNNRLYFRIYRKGRQGRKGSKREKIKELGPRHIYPFTKLFIYPVRSGAECLLHEIYILRRWILSNIVDKMSSCTSVRGELCPDAGTYWIRSA